jgi:hypothetical protein
MFGEMFGHQNLSKNNGMSGATGKLGLACNAARRWPCHRTRI